MLNHWRVSARAFTPRPRYTASDNYGQNMNRLWAHNEELAAWKQLNQGFAVLWRPLTEDELAFVDTHGSAGLGIGSLPA